MKTVTITVLITLLVSGATFCGCSTNQPTPDTDPFWIYLDDQIPLRYDDYELWLANKIRSHIDGGHLFQINDYSGDRSLYIPVTLASTTATESYQFEFIVDDQSVVAWPIELYEGPLSFGQPVGDWMPGYFSLESVLPAREETGRDTAMLHGQLVCRAFENIDAAKDSQGRLVFAFLVPLPVVGD